MTIWKGGNQTVRFAFCEKPRVTYESNTMVIKTDRTTTRYPLTEVSLITFEEDLSVIEGRMMQIDNLFGSTMVYTMSGALLLSAEKGRSLSLDRLPSGKYLIVQGGVKFILDIR